MLAPLIALALLPGCERSAEAPRLRADLAPGVLAVCDRRRGRRVLVRHGTIPDASAAGRLVVWTQLRVRDGCPDRGDFAVGYHDDRVQVSEARYEEDDGFVQRVCVRGSRRDHVIDQDDLDLFDGRRHSRTGSRTCG